MAKKMSKLLIFGAAVGVAAAGTYYLLKKSDEDRFDDDDFDDFDDFDDDDDDDYENGTESAERNYVPLNLNMSNAEENASPKEETIEEFFDEEDEEKDSDDLLTIEE